MNNKEQVEYDPYLSYSPQPLSPALSGDVDQDVPAAKMDPKLFESYMKDVSDRLHTGIEVVSKEMHGWVDQMMELMEKEVLGDLEKDLKMGREAIKSIQAKELEEEMMTDQINQYTSRVRQLHNDIFPKVDDE